MNTAPWMLAEDLVGQLRTLRDLLRLFWLDEEETDGPLLEHLQNGPVVFTTAGGSVLRAARPYAWKALTTARELWDKAPRSRPEGWPSVREGRLLALALALEGIRTDMALPEDLETLGDLYPMAKAEHAYAEEVFERLRAAAQETKEVES